MNEFLDDDELSFDEKQELLNMVDEIEKEFQHVDELKSLIKK